MSPRQLVEELEGRRLLAWGPYPSLIDQDELVARYPAVTGKGVTVAVIDTGMDFGHPKLQGKWWTNPGEVPNNRIDDDRNGYVDDHRGYDFYRGDGEPNDENSHGTQMGGIIAGHMWQSGGFDYAGIAPDAKIVSLKVADPTGRIDDIEFCRRVERALRWVEQNRVRAGISIVSMSIKVDEADFKATFADEVQRLHDAGVFIVASAGHFEPLADQVVWPARHPAVYAAGLIDAGDRMVDVGQRGPDLDILAPGDRIPILHKGSAYLISGTASSYPTPFIAAAAALIEQVHPPFGPADILSILKDSGKAITDPRPGGRTYKRLDLDDAVRLAYERIPPSTAQQRPFHGTPFNATARIQAEDFDEGGEGIAHRDRNTRLSSVAHRRTSVGIAPLAGGNHAVTSTRKGEWLEYTIDVPATGTYTFEARVAAIAKAAFRVYIDDVLTIPRLNVRDTDGAWRTYRRAGVQLTAGTHVMRILFAAEARNKAGNYDYFRFVPA